MKKIIFAFALSFMLTGCTGASDILSGIQDGFNSATSSLQQDIQDINSRRQQNSDRGISTLQDEISDVREKKKAELEPINKQISEKEGQIVKILMDRKLTASQKKAKTSLIQKDINTLKLQKEQIEEKYRKMIANFRY